MTTIKDVHWINRKDFPIRVHEEMSPYVVVVFFIHWQKKSGSSLYDLSALSWATVRIR